jgi:predicted nucleic acid-binding protein
VAHLFFDTSAIVKRYVNEAGTPWVLGLVVPSSGNRVYLARITGVEVISAVARRQRGGSLSTAEAALVLGRFRHHFATDYRVVAMTPTVFNQAMVLAETHALRGYDAVQLAAALLLNRRRLGRGLPSVTLLSADGDLNAAAAVEGLAVENPNAHP